MLLPIEQELPLGAGKTIYGDLVVVRSEGVEAHTAGVMAAVIVVTGLFRQIAHGVAGIDGQQRIEGAATGIKGRHAGGRGEPGVPNGLATTLAGMERFAGFTGGVEIVAHVGAAHAEEQVAVGEIIVRFDGAQAVGP